MPTLVVASFNAHAGIDGWGRPFDVVGACRSFGADVLVIEENFAPRAGVSIAAAVGDELGYQVMEVPLERSWRLSPSPALPPSAGERWLPGRRDKQLSSVRVGTRYASARKQPRERGRTLEEGTFGFAVLTRLPVAGSRQIDLGKLRRDYLPRAALAVDLMVGERAIRVIGTHMSHLAHGSALQYRRLARALGPAAGPEVLAGDMNLWGIGVEAFLPGWRRAVHGRTFPSWRPLAGIDHILVRGGARVDSARVLEDAGSDHRPVQATISV